MKAVCDDTSRIVGKEVLKGGYVRMFFSLARPFVGAVPGQFVHILVEPGGEPFLRRPFAIHGLAGRIVTVIFRVRGRGTALLAGKNRMDTVSILGPLGNGYDMSALRGGTLVFIAGGAGVASLAFLAQVSASAKPRARRILMLYGANTRDELAALPLLRKTGIEIRIATMDGSMGRRGPVTALLDGIGAEKDIAGIFSCGPDGMMKQISRYCATKGICGQVCLESRMACGVGACLGCVVRVRDKTGRDVIYRRVCRDGPVFDTREVIWQ